MISLDCPSTITGRSAADGNHMPAGLTSPSQSLSKGRGDEEERREERRHKAGKESSAEQRGERSPKGRGRDERSGRGEVENIKCQSLMA